MTEVVQKPPRRVLVVDGEAEARKALAEQLRMRGMKVFQARGADEAFEMYRDVRPDVVLTEVILPEGSGLDLCARVHEAGTPVILTSAVVRSDEQQRLAREQYGAQAYHVKPVDSDVLCTEIERLASGAAPSERVDLRPQPLLLQPGALENGGSLGAFSYPLLLMAVFRARETGVLNLERQYASRTVYFLRGVPVFVASANRQENLGRLLVEKGRITEEDYLKSTRLMQEKKIRQGEALTELGLLTYQELYAALQEQAHEKLIQGFGWTDGMFSFSRTESFLDKLTLLELDSHAAIAEGVKRFYGLAELAPLYEPVQTAYPQVNENFVRYFDRLQLTEAERRFAASLRGLEAFRDLAGQSNVEIRDLLRILTILFLCDMVTLRPNQRPADTAAVNISRKTGDLTEENLRKEDEDMREVILENYLRVNSYNYFQVLGVKPDAAADVIEKQYQKLSKKYHPDNYKNFNLGPVGAKLEEIFLKVELAYRTLSGTASRAEYEAFLERSKEIVLSDLSATLGAEMEFCRGQELIEIGNFEGAIDALRMAVEQNPLEPEYHTLFGVALFRSDPERAVEARSHINRALAIDPNNASALVELGRIFAFQGKHGLAKRHFEAALRVKPNDEAIQRDLQLVEQYEKTSQRA